jgi:ATP-binding protein involved in chromosome partitioning
MGRPLLLLDYSTACVFALFSSVRLATVWPVEFTRKVVVSGLACLVNRLYVWRKHQADRPSGIGAADIGGNQEFSSMADVTKDRVVDALRSVRDAERGGDLVALDMISGVAVREGHVQFAIEVDPKRGPALEPLRQEAEKVVSALPGVLSVSAVLTAERAPSADAPPQPAPSRQAPQQQRPAPKVGGQGGLQLPEIKAIVAVASGKGGVGKSTVAVNLALALHTQGHAVGLLDADIYGPSMPRMMGLSGKPHSPDGQRLDPLQAHGLKVMSIGFLIDEETPMIWRGPMVQSALVQMLRDVNWGPLDILIVDMPPGTGDAQLTMAQQVPLSGAVIVSTPQDIALLDARKGLNMFRKVDVPVLGIVENMSIFVCPHCGEASEIFGHGGARTEAERLGVPFLGALPLHMAIRTTSDGGTPIVASQPESAEARAFLDVADRVADGLSGAAQKPPPRIVTV